MKFIAFDAEGKKPKTTDGSRVVHLHPFSVNFQSYHTYSFTLRYYENTDASVRFCSIYHDDLFCSEALVNKIFDSEIADTILIPWLTGDYFPLIGSYQNAIELDTKKMLEQ